MSNAGVQTQAQESLVGPSWVTLVSLLQWRRQKYAILGLSLVVDLILFAAALFAANLIYFKMHVPAENFLIYKKLFFYYLGAKALIFFVFGLYNDSAFEVRSTTLMTVVEVTIVATLLELFLIASIILYTNPRLYKFSRFALVWKAGLEILLIGAWRVALIRAIESRQWLQMRTLLVGMGRQGADLIEKIRRNSRRRLIGYVDSRPAEKSPAQDMPWLGEPDECARILQDSRVDEVIIVGGAQMRDRVLRALCHLSVSIKVLPQGLEMLTSRMDTCEIGDVPLIEINKSNITLSTVALKRAFDIAAASLGLLFFSPILGFLWALYRVRYGGDLFYSQPRIGRGGRIFTILKIRTMIKDAEKKTGAVISHGRDPRVLGVGWILRRTHLDELPQLINILRGDMSLVGPRPERPERAEKFTQDNPSYNLRHMVRPGLAGLAQVKAKYDTHFEYKLFYDLLYAFNVSLLLDLKILYYTPKYIFAEIFGEKNQY